MQFEARINHRGWFAGVHNGIDVFSRDASKAAVIESNEVDRLAKDYQSRNVVLVLAGNNGAVAPAQGE